MSTGEPCLVYVSEDLFELPVPPSDDQSSGWPESDSETETESDSTRRSAPFGRFTWSNCLSDTKHAVPGLSTHPRAQRPDWAYAGSKQAVALLASGSTLAVASQDGSLTLLQPSRSDEGPPTKKPDMGKRKASDRSLHNVGAIMPPGAYGGPRKASATISVTDIDVAGAVRGMRQSRGAAAEALVAVSPHSNGSDPPSPKRTSLMGSLATGHHESTEDTASLASVPMSPEIDPPTSVAPDFCVSRLEPFAQTLVTHRYNTIVDIVAADEGGKCLILTSDSRLERISLIDGGICDTLHLDTSNAPRPRSIQTIQLDSAHYAFIFTDTTVFYAVCIKTFQVVSRLYLPQPPSAAAITETQQGDLVVAYASARSRVVQWLPLVSVARPHHHHSHGFMLASPHHPVALDLEAGYITDLKGQNKTLLCVVGGDLLGLEVDEREPIMTRRVGQLEAVVVLASSPNFVALRCRDASTRFVRLDSGEPKEMGSPHLQFSPGEVESVSFVTNESACLSVQTGLHRRVLGLDLTKAMSQESYTELFSSPKSTPAPLISQTLMLSGSYIFGYASGHIASVDLDNSERRLSAWSLKSPISCLSKGSSSKDGLNIVAGSEKGDVAIFNAELSLLQTWNVFTSPVLSVMMVEHDNVGRLNGTLVIISSNCTTALLPVNDPSSSIMSLPGSDTPLQEIRVREGEIILSYAAGMWRQWDAQTGELRRSVQEPLAALAPEETDQWWVYSMGTARTDSSSDTAIPLDLRSLGSQFCSTVSSLKKLRSSTPSRYHLMKGLLSDLLPSQIDKAIDSLQERVLGCERSQSDYFVVEQKARLSRLRRRRPASALRISARVTARRTMPILAFLRFMQNFADCEHAVRSASDALIVNLRLGRSSTMMLSDALTVFAVYWSDSNGETQAAARAVIESTISRMTNEVAVAQATYWHTQVFLREDDLVLVERTVAVLLLALIAIQHFDRLDAGMLLATAHCIVETISSVDQQSRLLATELFGRGLQLWQNQLDVLPAIADLIDIGFAESDEAGGGGIDRELRQAARSALLQVVGINASLFSSAINLDSLHAANTRHRIAVMRLVAFIIRKKPILLLWSVPKIVEAAVKALDPLSRTARSTVQPAATFLLQELVKTYPSVSFHESTQRLAAGNPDGGVTMYDVKSATRLYVLDFHQKPVTAVSFAPDGRRLVTVALDEARIAVWKVGSSLLGMLHAGGPPRQGTQGTSKPYQTYDFVHAEDNVHMVTASTLHLVAWDWPAERTARLRIRATQLTFPTA